MPFTVPYTESATPPIRKILWIVTLLTLLTAAIGFRELTRNEASLATIADEMLLNGDFMSTTIHGRPVQVFPLYSWCSSITSYLIPGEIGVRLPALLALAAMAGICFIFTRSQAGSQAAWISAVIPLTTIASLGINGAAGNSILMAFFIGAAWLCWYYFGRIDKQWPRAWLYSLLLVVAASGAGGIRAWAYFYFPLLFLRRPLHGLKRMGMTVHFLALTPACLLIVLWLRNAPEQIFLPWQSLRLFDVHPQTGGFITHLFRFLIGAFWLTLPWGGLAWPIFCMAFRSVEEFPVLCRYLRTILMSTFLICLFMPGVEPVALLPLICPFAVATGLYYEILMRRYFWHLHQLARITGAIGTILSGTGLFLALLHLAGIIVADALPRYNYITFSAMTLLAGSLALWAWKRRTAPCWMRLVIAMLAFSLLNAATRGNLYPYASRSALESAKLLTSSVPADTPIYHAAPEPLITECQYMKRPIYAIANPAELPPHDEVVYVLGGHKPPIQETREWQALTPPISTKKCNRPHLTWMPGGRCLLRIERCPLITSPDNQNCVRIYKGSLRPPVEEPLAPPAPTPEKNLKTET